MDLKGMIKKLRHAADSLEEVLGFNDSPASAVKIRESLKKKKYRKYKHWTQRPENKAKLKKSIKAMRAAKKVLNG